MTMQKRARSAHRNETYAERLQRLGTAARAARARDWQTPEDLRGRVPEQYLLLPPSMPMSIEYLRQQDRITEQMLQQNRS